MTKKNLFLLLFVQMFAVLTACAGKPKPTNISFVAHDTSVQQVQIQFAETDTVITLNVTGDPEAATKTLEGKFAVEVTEPTYGIITYRWKKSTVYLEPGKDFTMEWDLTPAALTVKATSKKSQINPYLCAGEHKGPVMGDFGKDPEEILDILAEYEQNAYKLLDSKKLDKEFVAKEKQRLTYWVYGFLAQYAQQKQCGDDVYAKLKELSSKEDAWLMQTSEYANFQYNALICLALRGHEPDGTPEGQTKAVTRILEYTVENIHNNELLQYIIGTQAVSHVANNGYDGAERIKEIVDKHVTAPEIKYAFDLAWQNGNVLKKGRPSPDFAFPDINGKTVTLADLRGKYVYIDCWATWCVPCRGEIPHLKKLEETFHGMNIAFVSISCDRDRNKWETMVKEQELGGIQLWGDEDNEFFRKYRVQGIPRFIFLGPDGRIIDPDMTRPSDPKTMEAIGMVAMPM